MKKILLIGCGHMGNSLLDSWIVTNKYRLTVIDPNKHTLLKKKYKSKKIKILKSINLLNKVGDYDFIVLAIRPSELRFVLDDLSQFKFKNNSSLISVIAGKKIKLFKNKLTNIKNFFRVMPNLPASIGESMNCIVASKNVVNIKRNQIINLFSYSGKTLILEDENQIDMATAISGSGPGFVFNLIDALENAAISLGFKKQIAKILVSQTFKGSIDLLIKNKFNAKDMVQKVATKGGTTEAGLNVMKKYKIHQTFKKMTKTSYERAKFQGK